MDLETAGRPTVKFALMVDHYDMTASGKPILVGVFNSYIGRRGENGRVPIRGGFLVAQIHASLAFGIKHDVALVCRNADNEMVFSWPARTVQFVSMGAGMPLQGLLAAPILSIEFPDFGQYEWVLIVEDREIGNCAFAVWEIQSSG